MNIYAERGSKVRFANPTAGYEFDQEQCRKLLTLGAVYTVASTDVERFSTAVQLKEVPGVRFNSVMFEDAE